jgi:GNAT superfamily N-acetyltransferase
VLIRPLQRSDQRDSFESGEPALDQFIRRYAGQDKYRHHVSATYVAVDEATGWVAGYLTVTPAVLLRDDAPSTLTASLSRYPLPVLRVARLGVDRRAQGQGIGTGLVMYACELAVVQAELLGCVGLTVDALRPSAAFYESLGFIRIDLVSGGGASRPRPVPMFLGIGKIQNALEGHEKA